MEDITDVLTGIITIMEIIIIIAMSTNITMYMTMITLIVMEIVKVIIINMNTTILMNIKIAVMITSLEIVLLVMVLYLTAREHQHKYLNQVRRKVLVNKNFRMIRSLLCNRSLSK